MLISIFAITLNLACYPATTEEQHSASSSVPQSIRAKPFLKELVSAPIIHVVEQSKGGTRWDIWRKNSGEFVASSGGQRILDNRALLENGKWRTVVPGDNIPTLAIHTIIDWIEHGQHYDRGGSDSTGGFFMWDSRRIPKTTISWVYGEPMQGATEIICDARTGIPRIVIEDFWGVPVSEAKVNNKRTVVYVLQIDLDVQWPKWAE